MEVAEVPPEKLNLGINHKISIPLPSFLGLGPTYRRFILWRGNNISHRHKNSTIHQTVVYSTVFVPISLISPATLARSARDVPEEPSTTFQQASNRSYSLIRSRSWSAKLWSLGSARNRNEASIHARATRRANRDCCCSARGTFWEEWF